MGVPGFFASLLSKYKNRNFVFTRLDLLGEKFFNPQELYLDTNCLIHPVCFRVANENQSLIETNPARLEDKMIKEVILYIEHIINYVKPTKLVYIAIDGVAPMAKIKHQRLRRFKSVLDTETKSNIAHKHSVPFIKPWNNSAITPGTEFMDKLTKAIINYLNIKRSANISNEEKVKYIFSTANTSGEGEHKILQYIKEHKEDNEECSRIIYGLDADLLYLSLASGAKNIYLLREITEFQKDLVKTNEEFCYVSIDTMSDCVFETITENLEFANLTNYKDNFIKDYIFMGFLLGNDFLPGLPSVNLMITGRGLNGLDILISTYKEVFEQINKLNVTNYEFIVGIDEQNKIILNYNFILGLFKALDAQEETYWRARAKYRRYIPQCEKTDPYSIEIHRIENLMFKIPDIFELGKEGVPLIESKRRYYAHYYNSDYNEVRSTIDEYFKGLYWNAYYYFSKCVDWTFYFPHHKMPFVSDIYEWLTKSKDSFTESSTIYPKPNDNQKLIHPLQQLFMVLPVQSAYLLPAAFKQKMTSPEMVDFFPRKIELDLQLITRYWQALPEIKMIEPVYGWTQIRNINLTEKEQNRNKFKKPYELII